MRRWDSTLWLITPEEYSKVPDGTVLHCIDSCDYTKGVDQIDMDTRGGLIAYGFLQPLIEHPLSELLLTFKLS